MNYHRLVHVYIFTIISGFSPIIAAATANQLQAVKEAAKSYVETQIPLQKYGTLNLETGHLDPRLHLTDCPTSLKTSIPGRQSLNKSVTVMVSCDEDNWQIYIPVEIHLLTPVVVAKRPLARGMTLNENDLIVQMVDARFQRGQTYSHLSTLVGSRIKRVVGIGKPIQGNDVCMVCRNDNVVITASKNALNIVAKGTALSDGALGEQIKVKNSKSNRILDAKITAVGHVNINF